MINNKNDPSAAVGDDYSDMWTDPPFSASNPLHRGLKEMEENLRCYICRDFMTAPVSVDPCHHTFCSFCVQNHARACLTGTYRRKMDCPSCRVEITGTNINNRLTPSPTVENLVKAFKGIRSQLKQALLISQQGGSESSNQGETVVSDDSQKLAAKTVLEEVSTLQQKLEKENDGRRKCTRKNYAEMIDMDDNDDDVDENYNPKEDDEVEVVQPKTNNNNTQQQQREYAKKLPKPMYGHLKLNQRKKLCRDEGLSDAGSMEQLKERHERFVTRYNSYCDSLEPKSKAEVAREVHEEEKARKRERSRGASAEEAIEKLKRNREQMGKSETVGANVVAQSGVEWFDQEMNENFARLIAKGRERLKEKQQKNLPLGGSEDNNIKYPSEANTEKETASADSGDVDNGPAMQPSDTPAVAALSGEQHSCTSTATSKPSSTQTAYDPEAVAGISNQSMSFSPNAVIDTPAVPKLFQPGSNAPSTISHKQSQQSSLANEGSVDLLPKASDRASSSPSAALEIASGPSASAQPQSFTVAEAELKARHEAARAYALAETNANKNHSANQQQQPQKKKKSKKRSPSNLLEAGVTKTRRTIAPSAPAPTRRSGRSIVGPWICQVCTYHNETRTWSTATCQMCHSKRADQGQGASNLREATVSL